MKKVILHLLFLNIFSGTAIAQNNYASNLIPASLLNEADAVVRTEEISYDYKSISHGVLKKKVAITVLNAKGDNFSSFFEAYDKLSSISNLKASLFDASGKKIKDYKSSDFKDESLVSSGTIYQDNRLKYLHVSANNYPYTFEYSYTKEYNGILTLPNWQSNNFFRVSTEKSSYRLNSNPTLTIRYIKSPGLKIDSTITNQSKLYSWSVQNAPAIEKEPLGQDLESLSLWVKVAPNEFEFDNSKGNLKNWASLGTWISDLNKQGDDLPIQMINKVKELTLNANTEREKVQILYDYLQNHTRYVSVQLGIGGFKPIPATKVSEVKYGDCKGLSNYMKALLKAANISSNLVVIGNGMPGLNPAFSSIGQANHMILAVPLKEETLFLECTSQEYPMGYIGHGNSNKEVLIVENGSGRLLKTPEYRWQDNYLKNLTTIKIESDLLATITANTKYGHVQYESYIQFLSEQPINIRKITLDELKFSDVLDLSIKYEQPRKEIPEIIESLGYKTKSLLQKSGNYYILTPMVFKTYNSIPNRTPNRKQSFSLDLGYFDEHQIEIQLPEDLKIEAIPSPVKLDTEFGVYEMEITPKDNKIFYTRKLTIYEKEYPAELYEKYISFKRAIQQGDQSKVALIKK